MYKIAIASDHGGVDVKSFLKNKLKKSGYDIIDLGTHNDEAVDYPDYANKIADVIKDGSVDYGILICGTGIGISIAANRHHHIRAALCSTTTDARLARAHNDANVIALGARTMGEILILDCVKIFLSTDFVAGRHALRIKKIS